MSSQRRQRLRLTVMQANGCTETDDVVLTVKPLPVCFDHRPGTGLPAVQRAISWPGRHGLLCLVGHRQRLDLRADQCADRDRELRQRSAGTNFTLSLVVTSNGCPGTCTTEVMVNDTTAPTLIACPPDRVLECPGTPGPT